MYMRIHIYTVYIYMCMCVYVYVCVCMYIYMYVCVYVYAGGILPDFSYTYPWNSFRHRLVTACVRDHVKAFLQRRVPLGHAWARDRLVRAGPVSRLVGIEVLCRRNAADFLRFTMKKMGTN